jgi:MoxR-like ATPase
MNLSHRIIENVSNVLLGKPDTIRLAVSCFLGEGHLLIDDIPGVGKTTLALALAKSIGCEFQRIQFTSDLLPSDVLGVSIFNQKNQNFDFKPGPVFHNVVLADEINRASPKTQSALLECMQEGQVSIDNVTHPLPKPFFVIATQNPHEHHGTFPLPESQLDRFMMKLSLGYPSADDEAAILRDDSRSPRLSHASAVGSPAEAVKEFEAVRAVNMDASLDRYIVELARRTRESQVIDLGLSPRGTLALRRAAQAFARTFERDYVTPDDIKKVAVAVIAHRIRLKGGHYNGNSARVADTIIHEILDQVPIPA